MNLSAESNKFGYKIKVGHSECEPKTFYVKVSAYRKFCGIFWVKVPGHWVFVWKSVSEEKLEMAIEECVNAFNNWVHRELLAKSKSG